MGTNLGKRDDLLPVLQKALMLEKVQNLPDGRWLGRSRSNLVAVEVEGDPITRVSLVLPVRPGAGVIVGQFVNTFARAHRGFVARALRRWAVNPLRPFDKTQVVGSLRVRVQGVAPLVTVTIYEAGT